MTASREHSSGNYGYDFGGHEPVDFGWLEEAVDGTGSGTDDQSGLYDDPFGSGGWAEDSGVGDTQYEGDNAVSSGYSGLDEQPFGTEAWDLAPGKPVSHEVGGRDPLAPEEFGAAAYNTALLDQRLDGGEY